MLNFVLNLFQSWFSISTKSIDYETRNQPMKQVQGMVQGDK